MTAHKDPWVACDVPDCLTQFPDEAGDMTDVPIFEIRWLATKAGWRCTRRGDLCPEHA